ncbi:hypothetical protein Y032_0009g740 [Ancylostoma ceylanicum]|uniref:Uncharacterized protein n=1 Tax=Ancylostoma ceylanicum TaxID=53326 RepID=A0A016VKA1_9BILA|nr:hypothetical protein Y032_0009g740 [Ancylostoma ceylanicum]
MVTWSAGKRGCSAGKRGRLWIPDRCGGLVGADSLYSLIVVFGFLSIMDDPIETEVESERFDEERAYRHVSAKKLSCETWETSEACISINIFVFNLY